MANTENPTYKEVIDILKYVKKYQPVKTDVWKSSADEVGLLWFACSEGLVKTTDNGYELTELGSSLLNAKRVSVK